MPIINTVGIFSKPGVEAAARLVPKLVEWLRARGIEAHAHDAAPHDAQAEEPQ